MQLHELTPGLYRISKTIPNPRIDGRSNDWRLQIACEEFAIRCAEIEARRG